MSFPWCVPQPARQHNRNLQSSLSRHEQESSQHMAAVASYLASLSPSPSPLVTSIHMCSPFFLSHSPPFRPLRSLALYLPYPSLAPSLSASRATSLLFLSHFLLDKKIFLFLTVTKKKPINKWTQKLLHF